MKFVTFETRSAPPQPGVLRNDGTIAGLGETFPRLLDLIDAGPEGLAVARRAAERPSSPIPLADAVLLAPLPRPRQIRDFMLFEKHVRQALEQNQRQAGVADPRVEIPQVWYRQPVYYKANRFSVIGTEHDIQWPAYAERLDFELEIAAVIGRGGKDIAPEAAPGHVFGYMIFNDVSARDAQMAELGGFLGPAKGKDFDTGNVFGPWLVTADEVGDVRDLAVRASVNGELVAETTTADMHHDVGAVLAHVSASETLHPGEVLGFGTVGDCCLLEHGRALSPGDVIELEVEKLGRLRNRIVRRG